MTDPFPFQAKGGVVFKNVAVLNEFLRNLGLEPDASGAINVNFAGSGDAHNPSGKLQVSGNQLQYHGVVVQDLDIRAIVEKTKAEIQRCRVTLDPHNRVELQGTAQLADPYPYAVNGTIALTDLAVFDGLIKSLGQPPGLSGALNGSFSVDWGRSTSWGAAAAFRRSIRISRPRGPDHPNQSGGRRCESGTSDLPFRGQSKRLHRCDRKCRDHLSFWISGSRRRSRCEILEPLTNCSRRPVNPAISEAA